MIAMHDTGCEGWFGENFTKSELCASQLQNYRTLNVYTKTNRRIIF